MERAVNLGLRAQLKSGNLLTGQRFVSLDIFPDAPDVEIDWRKVPTELPVVPSGLQDMETKIHNLLAKLEKMPLDGLAADLKKTLVTVDKLLKRIDEEILPDGKATLAKLKQSLENIDATLIGKDAAAQQQLREALQEIARAAQGVSRLTEYLERNPEALIRGKAQENRR